MKGSLRVNQDLENVLHWLNAYEICLNISKTEVALFKSARKRTNAPLQMKLTQQHILVKKIDENLNWKQQVCDLAIKLNWTNAVLSKLSRFNSEINKQISCMP